MSTEEITITGKKVDDMLVAGIRFRGEREDVPEVFGRLYQEVRPYVTGKGMLLHYYYDQTTDPGHDLEVCYPVSQTVERGEIESRVLKGGEMLSAIHTGPHGPAGEAGTIATGWRKVWDYVIKHQIMPDTDPRREVYIEGVAEHGSDSSQYVTELQLPYAFHRMERMAGNLDRLAGETARRQVLEGSEDLPSLTARERAEWFKGAMERLDVAGLEWQTIGEVMACGERFPKWRIEAMREKYRELGDIDKLIAVMDEDRWNGEHSYYGNPVRERNIIYQTKDPVSPEKYREATDEAEKRSYYCHCGLVRDLVREGKTMSKTYCYCGAGWSKQLWEGILGKPVQVEVLETVLAGDDHCRFAIHLPPEA